MKRLFHILSVVLVICSFAKSHSGEYKHQTSFNSKIAQDTLITQDLMDISDEGGYIESSYRNSLLSKCKVYIFFGTGKVEITYLFGCKKICVTETRYYYLTEISEVKSEDDMTIDYSIEYEIDYDGNVIGTSTSYHTDFFKEIKEVVPFELDSI